MSRLSFKKRAKARCECTDSGCPCCHGQCQHVAQHDLVRIDMADDTPIRLCHGCNDDAMSSGLFVEAPQEFNQDFPVDQQVDMLAGYWEDGR